MSRNTKIILAIVAGVLVVLCLCTGAAALAGSLLFLRSGSVTYGPSSARSVVEESVLVDPSLLTASGDEVPVVDLPEGWRQDYAMHVGGFRLVGYQPETGTGHIMLIAVPETSFMGVEELERHAYGYADRYGYKWNHTDMTVVDRKPITVREQATEMVIAEGNGSSGPWRQAMVSFRGEHGLILVLYGRPPGSYDQSVADALFASIR